jgi:hypothetical protein
VIDILESLTLPHSLKNDIKMTAKEVQDLEDSLEFCTQLDNPEAGNGGCSACMVGAVGALMSCFFNDEGLIEPYGSRRLETETLNLKVFEFLFHLVDDTGLVLVPLVLCIRWSALVTLGREGLVLELFVEVGCRFTTLPMQL